jgi:hypothetical protein
MDQRVELIHRIVAYPFAFVLAPLALAATLSGAVKLGRVPHRSLGRWYFYIMTFLYITGTVLTLTRHPWATWEFARNVVFNFFGFSMVLFGVRAMILFRRPGETRPAALDHALAGVLLANTVALGVLSLIPGLMMRLFFPVAVVLCVLEFRELRNGFAPRELLYRRHIRYVLASYFYVLTVASIVHLGDELPRTAKWIWPSVLGLLVVCAATATALPWHRYRARALRFGVASTIAVALLLGAYAGWELWRGSGTSPLGDDRTVESASPPGHER